MIIVIQKCCTKTIGQFPSAAKRLKFNTEVECTNCTTSKQPPATVTSFIAKSKCKFLILVSCFHVECHCIVVSAEMTLPCHPALNTPQYSILNTPTPFHSCTFLIAHALKKQSIAQCDTLAHCCTNWLERIQRKLYSLGWDLKAAASNFYKSSLEEGLSALYTV